MQQNTFDIQYLTPISLQQVPIFKDFLPRLKKTSLFGKLSQPGLTNRDKPENNPVVQDLHAKFTKMKSLDELEFHFPELEKDDE